MVQLATQTLAIIQAAIEKDQGASYRQMLGTILPKMEDAYRGEEDPFRSHLGASVIGKDCSFELWLGFRWTMQSKFPERILRLFNRGHLEEAHFVAMLIISGFQIWYETEDGGQFRISDHGGHFGSALDSVVQGLPELPAGESAYGEFKTHNDKSFKKLQKEGVVKSKPQHYTQMLVCMKKSSLKYGLYMAVNKNDDELYAEIITYEDTTPSYALKKAHDIIFTDQAPSRISDSPGWFECKFCDKSPICHGSDPIEINCRTCCHSTPTPNGKWHCEFHNAFLDKQEQMQGCSSHVYNPHLINRGQLIQGNAEENYIELELESGAIIKHGPKYITSEQLWARLEEDNET